ncbi:hypothetical protein Tco_0403719 [Tanacetum coccineum]
MVKTRNRKNFDFIGEHSKSREGPPQFSTTKNLYLLKNVVKFVGTHHSLDCSTGLNYKQTELEVDNRNHNKHRSHRSHNKDIVVADSGNNVEDTYPIILSFTHCGNKSILRVLRIIIVILPEHPSETMVFHNEDGNPARANIKQALGYLKDGDGDGNSQFLSCQVNNQMPRHDLHLS